MAKHPGRIDVKQAAPAERLPSDFDHFRALIAKMQMQGSLPKRLRQAGEFVLAHPQEVALATAAEIAEKAGVQPSTLVRFAQALGYAGFSDVQAIFRSRAREQWPEYGERLKALRDSPVDGGPLVLLSGFAQASRLSLDRLQNNISADALERAVTILAAARTIHLIGARRSYSVVTYLAYALAQLAIDARLIDQTGGLAPELVDLIREDDVVLAVSFTPYTPATLELTARAARRGITVVAITDTPFSPLVQSAKVWLEVADADHALFRSLTGTLVLAMTLAISVAERRELPKRTSSSAHEASEPRE